MTKPRSDLTTTWSADGREFRPAGADVGEHRCRDSLCLLRARIAHESITHPAHNIARDYASSYAACKEAISIFSIVNIALVTRSAFSTSGSFISSSNTFGVTCHDRPYLSFNQPQGPGLPPSAASAFQ